MLCDETKFSKIKRNPCNEIKQKANKIIKQVNEANQNSNNLLKPIVGDFDLGYAYGNVKTHKVGNKLRLIISQVPTPTYKLAKQLDNIIKPFLPQGYMLKSSTEFVELLQSQPYDGMLYSLDVESLFTNVPVNRTIDIIIEKVYNHQTINAPSIPMEVLKELLQICTTEVPFRDLVGKMYVQCDGIAMGLGPLGPTFELLYV